MAGTPRRDQDAVEISWALPIAAPGAAPTPAAAGRGDGHPPALARPLATARSQAPNQATNPAIAPGNPPATERGKFLRLYFRCSNQYARALPTPDGAGYLGRCPKCGKTVSFAIGEGGSSDRFFQVSCS